MAEYTRGNTRAHYDAIASKNKAALDRLVNLGAKSPWWKYKRPIRPRDLTVALLGGFRLQAGQPSSDGPTYRARVKAAVLAGTTSGGSDDDKHRFNCGVEFGIYEARRRYGLLDPARRGTDPNPELTENEHQEIEGLLRTWLLDAIQEFGPDHIA